MTTTTAPARPLPPSVVEQPTVAYRASEAAQLPATPRPSRTPWPGTLGRLNPTSDGLLGHADPPQSALLLGSADPAIGTPTFGPSA